MHTMVLGFAGYGLLLSSCVALFFLLRLGCIKDILKSPLHILSTSDTLISMITSIILLINQSVPLTSFEEDPLISDTNEIENRGLLQNRDSEKYDKNQTCMGFYYKYNDSWPHSETTNGTTNNCAFQHVLMHYAMFLVPFANAFMSLLIYSVQCSSGMSCVNEKCSSLTQVSQNMSKDLKIEDGDEEPALADSASSFRRRGSGTQEDSNVISKDPKIHRKKQETILTIPSAENTPMNSNKVQKFAGVGLITQWLVPVLVTVILYFSKTQDMNKLRELSEMECIFKINFPLESCDKVELTKIESSTNPDEGYNESIFEVEDPDTLRISYPDSEAIDQVVSSVRNVVQSALNNTCNNSTGLKYYGNSKPWNITKYITISNSTQKMTSDESEMLEKLTNIQQVLDNNKYLGILRTNECTTEIGNDSVKTDQETHGDEELRLFQDLLKNTGFETTVALPTPRPETKPQDLFPQDVTMAAEIMTHQDIQMNHISDTTDQIQGKNSTEEAFYQTSTENKTSIIKTVNLTGNSNDQIYADIIKRIRDTVIKVKVEGQTENLQNNYRGNNNKLKTSEPEIPPLRFGSRKIREDGKNSYAEYENQRFRQAEVYMDERCFLSTKFLKIHLLILLFFIYFIPVLVSGILQTRAIYMCKNVFQRIEAVDSKDFRISQIPDQTRITINENPASKTGWFLGEADNAIITDLASSQNIDRPNVSSLPSQRSARKDNKNEEYDSQFEDKKTAYKNVIHETRSMQMLFSILTKSLMLGVLMWTPAFLEILSKVFLCASTPPWLVNVLYLLGVSFGVVKNFFNVELAKINKNINEQIHGKENSVHPSA